MPTHTTTSGTPTPSPTTLLSQLLRGSLVTQLISVVATLGIADLLKGAQQRLHAAAGAERCRFVAGDFFGSVPEGGDAYVLKDIIHDWDEDRAVAILRNCHQAMTHHSGNSARLLLIEKVIPPGNAPFAGKFTDITMLLIAGGRERTAAEYQALLAQAEFRLTKIVPTLSPASVIEAVPA